VIEQKIYFVCFYFELINHFSDTLSVSRKDMKHNVSFEHFYAFDSTTVSLFLNILKGVGRDPKGDGRKKGGLKVHMLTDIHANTPLFVKITDALTHDKNFLQYLNLPSGSMVVFDKAYNYYQQYAKWTDDRVNFVCRLKENAKYEVIGKSLYEKSLQNNDFGVCKVEHIHVVYTDKNDCNKTKRVCLRLVFYKDERVGCINLSRIIGKLQQKKSL
jgi:transposase